MIESSFWWTYLGFAFVIGACAGSFVNVLIARLPYDASLIPRSHCPSCGAPVRPFDLVPILSWLWLQGRCRDCGASIAPTYPLVELLGGLVAALLFVRIFPGFDDLTVTNAASFAFYLIFASALIAMSYTDLRHAIIPDQLSTWLIPVGVLGAASLQGIGVEGWPAPGWQQSVLGAAAGGLVLGAFALVGRLLSGREVLGWGDAKLMAMIGSFVGVIPGVWVILLVGSLLASVVGLLHLVWTRRRSYLPLGPVLGLVSLAYVLYGEELIPLFLPVSLLIEGWP